MGREAFSHEFDLPEGWQESILGMYEKGYPNDEVIAWILKNRPCRNFTRNLFNKWRNTIEEFKEVIDKGQILKKAWWLQQGRENIGNCKYNVPLYIRMMGNMFGWKSEITSQEVKDSRASTHDLSKLTTEELEMHKKLLKKTRKTDENAPTEEPGNAIPGRFGT